MATALSCPLPRGALRRLRVPLRALVSAAIGGLFLLPGLVGAQELGPAPRAADGRFMNWKGEVGHGTLGVRLPFFWRRMTGAFVEKPGAPARIANDGAFLRENARHSIPTVTWVGHATFLVQMDHVSFLTDPIWSDTASPVSWAGPRRHVPPGLAFEDLPPIDFVVISHNHYDHLDLATLKRLARRSAETRFLVPLGNAELLASEGIENVSEFDWTDSLQIGDVQVHALPSQHWSRRGFFDDQRALWASWAILGAQRKFYFAGDTGYFPGFARIGAAHGPFDLAALPIGAYAPRPMMAESHMNPEEAVQASQDLRAERSVGMHFGTFDLTDEPLDEPPRRYLEAARKAGIPEEQSWVLQIGETRPF